MSHLFRATTAFVFAALITGQVPALSPHWRAVAADLHQAQPQAKVEAKVQAAVLSLFGGRV
jgi:hypothetical protein